MDDTAQQTASHPDDRHDQAMDRVPDQDDPYRHLEDVTGEEALAWVRLRNDASAAALATDPGFAELQADLLAVVDSDDRIAYVTKRGPHYYNYWRDSRNPRGLWRRTTPEEYRKPQPRWEVLIDLDAHNEAEGENWVWGGAHGLRPAGPPGKAPYERFLITLSRGGADASVTREFDATTRDWVADGFHRPEAKGSLSWRDEDTVFVATDFGDGSMTESGYPRVVKLWRRGTPMSEATTIFEGRAADVVVGAWHDFTDGYRRDLARRRPTFFTQELYLGDGDGGFARLDLPDTVKSSVHRDWLLVEPREPYPVGGRTWPAGALLVIALTDFLTGGRDFTAVFTPTATTSLESHGWTRNHLLLNVLDDVASRVYAVTPGSWRRRPLDGVPPLGAVSVWAVDDEESDDHWMTVTDFLTPTTLYTGSVGGGTEALAQLPAFFESAGLTVSQHFATSADGTRVPYFLVAGRDLAADGTNPTLLYGYGGFERSLTPSYSGAVGRGWLAAGGVYAVANIRGGGEYGPRWHQAALKADRGRAYEDFAAVAEDLVARGVTASAHLGTRGRSNGGLLVGNMLTRYPRLFGAVVCEVPLLDMRRYHQLLAGGSWMAEYGDPDDPAEWEWLRRFSPYHTVSATETYPPVLFTTSTRDDRVHPGHARKMMARMTAQGHDALYYENIEGGHGGAADNRQWAYREALVYTFLRRHLFPAS